MTKKNNPIKRKLEGVVVSDKMQKTVVVKIERFKRHPLYHKVMRVSKRFKAHDENNECKVGDVVIIEQTRPLSKEKRWKVVQIVKRAQQEEPEEDNKEIAGEEESINSNLNQ
jgi:small subunit ribosomal protein S17